MEFQTELDDIPSLVFVLTKLDGDSQAEKEIFLGR
jgi:hypothetical protein